MLCNALLLLICVRSSDSDTLSSIIQRSIGGKGEHAPIIQNVTIEPIESEGQETAPPSASDRPPSIGGSAQKDDGASRSAYTRNWGTSSSLPGKQEREGGKEPQPAKEPACYVASYKNSSTDNEFVHYLSTLGVQPTTSYKKHFTGVYFCSEDASVISKIQSYYLLEHLEKEKVYTTASVQTDVPRHMLLMQKYTNSILGNRVYDNFVTRYLFSTTPFKTLFRRYKYSYTGKGVDIYLVDTSVDKHSPELNGRAFNHSEPESICNAHGTNVATLIGGLTMGFAKESHLYVLDGVDCTGKITLSKILDQLETWERKNGRRSILMFGVSGPFSDILNTAVGSVVRSGTPVVTVAGNNGGSACRYSPGSSKDVINVGSVDKFAKISSFTNYGSCVSIYSLGEEAEFGSTFFSAYEFYGTSASAALVTGALALFLEKHPEASEAQAWKFIQKNSLRVSNLYTVQQMPALSKNADTEARQNVRSLMLRRNNYLSDIFMVLFFAFLIVLLIMYRRRRRRRREMLMVPQIYREEVLCYGKH